MERWIEVVYTELEHIAHRQMRAERGGHTLETSALLNEAFLKLSGGDGLQWRGRVEFLALASMAMRQVLVEYARKRQTLKRGAGWTQVTVDFERECFGGEAFPLERIVELDTSLERLARLSPEQAQVVQLHVFGGLTFSEIAAQHVRTSYAVERDWKVAKAWLSRDLGASGQR